VHSSFVKKVINSTGAAEAQGWLLPCKTVHQNIDDVPELASAKQQTVTQGAA
jgi:ABC-type proline/glycine betaine transport system substrate-binding protein